MRRVSGPAESVVVVGAGLGGLSAALWLAAAGRQVLVLEREPHPGGRAGLHTAAGYRFDTGPTVLTMPEVIAAPFAALGERLADWLTLRPVRPLYRARYTDGSRLDVHADTDEMAAEIASVCGPAEAAGYRRFVAFLRRLYQVEMAAFIDRNLDSPASLLGRETRRDLARLAALGGFRRLAPTVAGYLRDPRTQRAFTFQAMYAGLSPYQALALYAVISYLDCVGGVYVPDGGVHALPSAMAGAAARHGVTIRYRTEVARVERRGRRATAVLTRDGERIPADAVVLNPDLPAARRDLLGLPPRPLRYSPSCAVLLAGSTRGYPEHAHHTVSFGAAWRRTFHELLRERRPMRDPSFLVTCPTATEPGLAPPGRHAYYVLFPTPNLAGRARLDWDALAPAYRDHMVATLEARGWPGFGAGVEVERLTTPADWRRLGMAAGTPFGPAHTLSQTGPFRPRNLWGDNVVFAGCGTHPGVGVPTVLISGRLAAERIAGPLPGAHG